MIDRCPVCRRPVRPNVHGHIARHFDSIARAVCPASGVPYHITRDELTE